jgi:uncharacterized FAD-dependent dehydrogenase
MCGGYVTGKRNYRGQPPKWLFGLTLPARAARILDSLGARRVVELLAWLIKFTSSNNLWSGQQLMVRTQKNQIMNFPAGSSSNYYDIIIVGAGPAGLATANELIQKGISGSKILIVEMGPDILERMDSREMGLDEFNTYGLGGAGLFSDGKLYVVPERGGLFPSDPEIMKLWETLPNPNVEEDEARDLYKHAYELIEGLNIRIVQEEIDNDAINQMRNLFDQQGIYFEYYESRQILSSDLPRVINSLRDRLKSKGVTLKLSTKVLDITIDDKRNVKFLKCIQYQNNMVFSCRFLVLAVGKRGMGWFGRQADKLGIARASRPIQIGVRVEVPNSVLAPFTKVHRDLQLIQKVNSHTLVQTFCTCHGGVVTPCQYDNSLVLGGYTDQERKSQNTNFALLVKLDMKIADPIEYAVSIIRTTNILGEGKPLIQRLGDMKKGVASNIAAIQNNLVKTTLTKYTVGDINLAFPKFIVDALLETLTTFDKVISGINNDSNIISAPCLEFCYQKSLVSRNMETNKAGIYVAGDVAGYESGIIPAMGSGILSARGIIDQVK